MRIRPRRLTLLLTVVLLAPAGAGAQPFPRTAARRPLLLRSDTPMPGVPGAPADPAVIDAFGTTVDGVAVDGVARLSIAVPGASGYSCTGALIGPRTLLTSAHCVTDDLTGALVVAQDGVRARFVGPGDRPVDLQSTSVAVPASWRGFLDPDGDAGRDVALVGLADAPPWTAPYALFAGDPLFRDALFVGYGEFGSGATGPLGFDARRRWGLNRIDAVSDPYFGPGDAILWTDFDDGTTTGDAFCWAAGGADASGTEADPSCDTGRGGAEFGIGAGDSGGPLFIDGRIAAIASFGTAFCGDPDCETYARPPLRGAVEGWGSLSGFVSVAYNADWLAQQLELDAAPEPAASALVAVGLVVLGLFAPAHARHRRSARS
jgi:hypothetical protein